MKVKTVSWAWWAGALAVVVAGCHPDVDSIDRTQPNAIHKSQFEGLWYTRSTIIEADPESSSIEGLSSGMEKVRWEIREELLVAYRSYEFIPYAEGLTDEGRDFFGAPVAAYEIESHFDIQRDFNPTNGQESNVIVENTTDRPWFEREYVRVDWSQNLVGRPTEFWTGWDNFPEAFFSGTAAAAYYHQGDEETNIHRPVFTKDYFDVTNQFVVEPSPYYCSVNLLFQGVMRCGAANVLTRTSFRKVDPHDDYESLYYPDVAELKDEQGNIIVLNGEGRACDQYTPTACTIQSYDMDAAFGNFRVQRVAFDQERQFTTTGRIWLAGRYDLWERSFNPDGTKIDYAERQPKPIVFYGNVQFPREMEEGAERMAKEWNLPFSQVVALKQGLRTESGDPDLHAVWNQVRGDMWQFRRNDCHPENIVAYAQENDLMDVVNRIAGSQEGIHRGNVEQVCAAVQFAELRQGKTLDPADPTRAQAFTWQRKGDLRYNLQNYISSVQNGPWGMAQFGQDPETGEFVANVANYFGDAGDRVAQRGVDTIQWLNGDLDEEALFRGDLARQTVSRRIPTVNRVRSSVRRALTAEADRVAESAGSALFHRIAPDAEERRMRAMFGGTEIEKELLVNDELLRGLAGPLLYQPFGAFDPPTGLGGGLGNVAPVVPGQISEEALSAASPVNWGMTSISNEFMKAAYELGRGGFELADFFDPNLSGWAETFKGQDREVIYDKLRREMFKAIQTHEVGHALGLRHNFMGSMDALNYKREFWYEAFSDRPAIERWPEEAKPSPEDRNRRNELKYSSVMDYGFDLAIEGIHGIGEYDGAAIRFMYGQIVDVWDQDKIAIPDPRRYGEFARRCGHDSEFWGVPALLSWLDPSEIPRIFSQETVKNVAECGRQFDADRSCDSTLDGFYREVVARIESAAGANRPNACTLFVDNVNDLILNIKGDPASNRQGLPPTGAKNIFGARTFATVDEMMTQRIQAVANHPEYDDPDTAVDESEDGEDNDEDGVADDKGFDWSRYRFQVPYGYCSDILANFSWPRCQRWDTGWDFLEATEAQYNRLGRDYIFDHFRRDALVSSESTFESPRLYMARLQARRLFHFTNVFRYFLFQRQSAFQPDNYTDWEEAAYLGINALEEMLQEPEPGTYCLDPATNRYVLQTGAPTCPENAQFTPELGYGGSRYLNSSWTNEYYYKANRIGYLYDKWAAVQQMTTSSGFFARDLSDLFDRRAFSLGYLRVYLDPVMQRFSALIENEHTGYRPRVAPEVDAQGNPIVDETTNRFKLRVYAMPFFDTARPWDQGSMRDWLEAYPEIEPAWSYDLSYLALAYALGNWSGLYDFAPEFKNFTKIAIAGTPEDIDWGPDIEIVEFTDPETLITYRAPILEPFDTGNDGVAQEFRKYYGDRDYKDRGLYRTWGIGANILAAANEILTEQYEPAKVSCAQEGSGSSGCSDFAVAKNRLNEAVGYIDQVRKFVRRAELPD